MSVSLKDTVSARRTVSPKAVSAAENGAWVDKKELQYVMGMVNVGATTGSPTSFSVAGKIQHADDATGTNSADVTGATMTPITAVDNLGVIHLDLRGVKKFVRLVITPSFVGGTSPTVFVSGSLLFGIPKNAPVS